MNINNLWPHQKEAWDICNKYIEDYSAGITTRAALIQLPTGAGKSGIITLVSQLSKCKVILVLTPRSFLRNQLFKDINGEFFKKIDLDVINTETIVHNIVSGKDIELVDFTKKNIIVMTIQMYLQNTEIGCNFDLIIFDEGHYEPAFKWQNVVRKNDAPRLIFTATPYRNDFKKFNIDSRYIYMMSHTNAVDNKFLRKLKVLYINNEQNRFAENVLSKFNELKRNKLIPKNARLIIQCNSRNEIIQVCNQIKLLGNDDYVAIHYKFDNKDRLFSDVELAKSTNVDVTIWIHQYKLIEGVDDNRFRVLAIFNKMNNSRMFVQQVGRILRSSNTAKSQNAYLIDYTDKHHEKLWLNYIKYDHSIDENPDNLNYSYEDVFSKVASETVGITYIDKKFRNILNLKTLSPYNDIKIPLRVNIYKSKGMLSINELMNMVVSFYESKDNVVTELETNKENIKILITQSYSNSPYLVNDFYIENKLEVMIIIQLDEYIYANKSLPITQEMNNDIETISSEKLKKVFENSESTKLTSVNLVNSDISRYAIRSKAFSALSIEDVYPNIDDNMQICTRVTGQSSEFDVITGQKVNTNKYVGFNNGRVSRTVNKYVEIEKYMKWVEALNSKFDKEFKTIDTLERYAQRLDDVKKIVPKNILIEFDLVEEEYSNIEREEQFICKDFCFDVIDDTFNVTINDFKYTMKLLRKSKRYFISCPELEIEYLGGLGENYDNSDKSIIEYINELQCFRIIFEDPSICYYGGAFYKINLKLGKGFDSTQYKLGKCMYTSIILNNPITEKGTQDYYTKEMDTWDPSSLFGIISSLGKNNGMGSYFQDYIDERNTILICDDMGKESCDFILCNTAQNKVVFIHAKADVVQTIGGARVATSKLHEVCAQAQKNLVYLTTTNTRKPTNYLNWNKQWIDVEDRKNDIKKIVKSRICLPYKTTDPEELWNDIDSVIKNPNSDREVWLFLGNIYSKNAFEKKLEASFNSIDAIALQGYYLLNATMNQVGSIGAKFKVFCGI